MRSRVRTANTANKQVFGLGFSGLKLSIATRSDAGAARAELLNVLNSIRTAYRTANAPKSTATSNANTQPSGPAPAYLTQQTASYQLALTTLSSFESGLQQQQQQGGGLFGSGSLLGIG